jgi:hypothetical protein
LSQRLPGDVLGRDEVFAVVLADLMDGDDVGMIQCRCGAGFSLKTRDPFGIRGELRRQQLQGDLPVEPRVTRQVNFAHTSAA